MVENFNSRLRNYFTLRRQLGAEYLSLLQFFLNHRTFLRSRVPERAGKSPRQLMTGQAHAHWLTLLGFGLPHTAASARLTRWGDTSPRQFPNSAKYPEFLREGLARQCYPKTSVFEPRRRFQA